VFYLYSEKTAENVRRLNAKLLLSLQEIGVAASNGIVRIWIGSSKVSVYAHTVKCDQKQTKTTGATSGRFKLQCIAIATFCRFYLYLYS